MKTKLAIVFAAVLGLCGCSMTPQQGIALAGAESGNAYATYVLQKGGPSAVKALTDLVTELPQIPLGKVSAFNLGALQAELAQAKADLVTNPQASSQINSLISLVANNQGTLNGGIVTADQALVFAAFQNVANGIANAVQFYNGQHSVASP